MDNQSSPSTEANSPITGAIRHLLRPLVRLLLSHGISYQVFSELVRSTYVKVAEEEFTLDAKPQTDSRISLLTGIHRREISRLRSERTARVALPQHASMSALLLTIWSGHPEYLDEHSSPRPLPRLASKSGDVSFESMVRSVSKDFRARVVLDEWLRQGIVTLDQEDRVHLATDAFVQPQGIEEKVFYFGQNIHDHLAATVHNLAGSEPPLLERCVYYDRLSAASVRELGDYSRTAGMKALHTVNKRAAELQQRDQDNPNAAYRFNFGIYNFSESGPTNGNPGK
ncbi:MAG TPA: DUF6502 family protein [Gallionella sp.]